MIEITKAFKYRIYPTKSQISCMENQFSMLRYLYNWSLRERMDAYQSDGITITYYQQQNSLPELKVERPWFKGVYSQVLQDCLRRLDSAYQNFFRRVSEGAEEPGFPKFKKRGQWNSLTYPQYRDRPADIIRVPKVGNIPLVFHRQLPFNARVKTLTIIKEGTKWFACFSCKLPLVCERKQDLETAIGIDVGLIDFIYASDGSHVSAPKYFRKLQKKLAKLQRRFSKAPKYGPKWYKLLRAIQNTHYRIRCQRDDFLHKTANSLLEKADVIFHEDLDIKSMSASPKPKQDESGKYIPNGAAWKKGLNKSIADAGWGKFILILKGKAMDLGKRVVSVPAYGTSQICPKCGEVVKKSLSTRTHCCPKCEYTTNRDHAASENILALGLKSLA